MRTHSWRRSLLIWRPRCPTRSLPSKDGDHGLASASRSANHHLRRTWYKRRSAKSKRFRSEERTPTSIMPSWMKRGIQLYFAIIYIYTSSVNTWSLNFPMNTKPRSNLITCTFNRSVRNGIHSEVTKHSSSHESSPKQAPSSTQSEYHKNHKLYRVDYIYKYLLHAKKIKSGFVCRSNHTSLWKIRLKHHRNYSRYFGSHSTIR